MRDDAPAVKRAFTAGAEGFTDVVRRLGPDDWERPALGVWRVRDLVGHTSRALSTVETYLGKEPAPERLAGPVAYFLATRSALADADAVAQRGREAGVALGDDPARAVRVLAERVTGQVHDIDGDATVTTPVGTLTLLDYLPTRTFELAVHSLDLARAARIDAPDALLPAVTTACELAGRLAGHLPDAPDLLLLLTGRTGLREGLSIV